MCGSSIIYLQLFLLLTLFSWFPVMSIYQSVCLIILFSFIIKYKLLCIKKIRENLGLLVMLVFSQIGFWFASGKRARGRRDHIRLLTYSKPGIEFNDSYIFPVHPYFHTSNFSGVLSRYLVCISVPTPWWV